MSNYPAGAAADPRAPWLATEPFCNRCRDQPYRPGYVDCVCERGYVKPRVSPSPDAIKEALDECRAALQAMDDGEIPIMVCVDRINEAMEWVR